MSYLETSVSELSARPLSDDELRLIEDSWGQSHRRSRKTVANSNGELVWPDIAKLACLDGEVSRLPDERTIWRSNICDLS